MINELGGEEGVTQMITEGDNWSQPLHPSQIMVNFIHKSHDQRGGEGVSAKRSSLITGGRQGSTIFFSPSAKNISTRIFHEISWIYLKTPTLYFAFHNTPPLCVISARFHSKQFWNFFLMDSSVKLCTFAQKCSTT